MGKDKNRKDRHGGRIRPQVVVSRLGFAAVECLAPRGAIPATFSVSITGELFYVTGNGYHRPEGREQPRYLEGVLGGAKTAFLAARPEAGRFFLCRSTDRLMASHDRQPVADLVWID